MMRLFLLSCAGNGDAILQGAQCKHHGCSAVSSRRALSPSTDTITIADHLLGCCL